MRQLFKLSPGIILLGLGLVTAIALPFLYKRKTADKSPDTAIVTTSRPAPTPTSARPLPATHLESFAMPDPSASAEELLQLARNAVALSPHDALLWAQSCSDSQLREKLLFAVLQAWGEKEPNAAVDWALNQNSDERFI